MNKLCCKKCKGERFCKNSSCKCHWEKTTQPTTPPSAQTEWEKEFDQKFTYTDEDGNVFLLGGYDDDKKANTDNIPEIKLFIRKLLASERTRLLSEMEKGSV